MIDGERVADDIHRDVLLVARHCDAWEHLRRFAALFAGSLAVSLTSGGWHVAGWSALGSAGMGAAGVAAQRVWPRLPVPVVEAAIMRVLDAHRRGAPDTRPAVSTPTLRAPLAPDVS